MHFKFAIFQCCLLAFAHISCLRFLTLSHSLALVFHEICKHAENILRQFCTNDYNTAKKKYSRKPLGKKTAKIAKNFLWNIFQKTLIEIIFRHINFAKYFRRHRESFKNSSLVLGRRTRKISLASLITAVVLALRRARDCFFLDFVCHKMRSREKRVTQLSVWLSISCTHRRQTPRLTDRLTYASYPLYPITVAVRANKNCWLNYFPHGTCVSINTRKANKKKNVFSVFSPPESLLRRQRRLFSARLRPIDTIRCSQSFKRIEHPPAKPSHISTKCRRI